MHEVVPVILASPRIDGTGLAYAPEECGLVVGLLAVNGEDWIEISGEETGIGPAPLILSIASARRLVTSIGLLLAAPQARSAEA